MDFRTTIPIKKSINEIDHTQSLSLLGSCFTQHIGTKLMDFRFQTDINPFGPLYNPLSIAAAIERLIEKRVYTHQELVENAGIWHSQDHHSQFSHPDPAICLKQINDRYLPASERFTQITRLIVTFGSAFVYFDRADNRIVANCHKRPEHCFLRRLISPEEIAETWQKTIEKLHRIQPSIKIIFTVSPIRHIRDGFHANQLSKATLLLAIDQLERQNASIEYFPTYEIVNDELRDYRFYAADMLHPSDTTIEYIWERFAETYFSPKTQDFCREWGNINKALSHKPIIKDSIAYKNFIMQNLLKMKNIHEKYPFFDLQKEIHFVENLLNNNQLINETGNR